MAAGKLGETEESLSAKAAALAAKEGELGVTGKKLSDAEVRCAPCCVCFACCVRPAGITA